jgi:multimeric flavodoxin WrbA
MKYVYVNASPRKNMNTAKLLKTSADTLKKLGHDVQTFHLYDLNFTGCKSCFACKRTDKKSYGMCTLKDDIRDVLRCIKESDGLMIGSPIYFQDVPGEFRSFLERLLFQYFIYSKPPRSSFEGTKKVAMLYTMNIDEATYTANLTKSVVENLENKISFIYHAPVASYKSFGTNQLKSYEGIEYAYFDPKERLENAPTKFAQETDNIRRFTEEWIKA